MIEIEFKSNDDVYIFEEIDLKPNTIRKYVRGDNRFIILDKFSRNVIKDLNIRIVNAKTHKSFTRQVKHVYIWNAGEPDNLDLFFIISWRS